jgi:Arc/MetJ-type ribon-helix-helix transcriptional regulator
MREITVSMPDEQVEAIEERLEYGDSRSEWIRQAIDQRLEKEAESDSGNRTLAET